MRRCRRIPICKTGNYNMVFVNMNRSIEASRTLRHFCQGNYISVAPASYKLTIFVNYLPLNSKNSNNYESFYLNLYVPSRMWTSDLTSPDMTGCILDSTSDECKQHLRCTLLEHLFTHFFRVPLLS